MNASFGTGDRRGERDGSRPAGRKRPETETPSNVYVLSGEPDCSHPSHDRTYLGLQGESSFYRCNGCDGVIVVAR
ncbi:hypothetical protein [Halegenticoccus soli]|uniref:hypothetical protein n=1 Tax=Halegenticoccus soli TaxID=1985678 RepID=UPI000C6C9EC1|nr:hypothetical protein [Halegenticoccus soli]